MSSLMDLLHSVLAVVTSGDWLALGIMVVIAIGVGFVMQELGSILSSTVIALALFAVATYARGVVSAKGASAAALAQTDWHNLQSVTVHSLLAYGITFAIMIGAVYVVRTMVAR